MQPKTPQAFDSYTRGLGSWLGYNRDIKNEKVFYPPERQQSSYTTVAEKADFLKKVNHVPVNAQRGGHVGMGINTPIASRTDTDVEDRKTRYVGNVTGDEYDATQTNYDTHTKYSVLDAWAHLNLFHQSYGDHLNLQIARDQLMIGFNGTHAAKTSDFATNPLLQDVNVGWLEKTRQVEPKRIMGHDSTGLATTDTWKLGEGGQYRSFDALVFDLITNLLDVWHQGADDLMVLVGRDVWLSHGMILLGSSNLPTERAALQSWFAAQTVAGLPCVMPPFFPNRGVWVTSYSNLSVYHQLGTMRRFIFDNAKRDQVEEYRSENLAYVVEDYGKIAGVRNGALLLPDGAGGWA
ncbi:phage major capsid protein, P2 family [uncultured Thiothrix sp.]|uniref:phage major capsid protein, P2 family n=1 Tax=uncultured Thiothrix sp. TaxID=223185 RepID=UPI002617EA35|nr:phage major capsid protein, P2 family [uncultured Thiothrix sp.]HMT94923.1 phage major capsid protein, P2 family [Thiolinea sp.]